MINKTRIKKLEEKMGLSVDRTYWFMHFDYSCVSEAEGGIFYEKDDFKGHVVIWEMHGKNFSRDVPSGSEEGKRILIEKGYRIVNLIEQFGRFNI